MRILKVLMALKSTSAPQKLMLCLTFRQPGNGKGEFGAKLPLKVPPDKKVAKSSFWDRCTVGEIMLQVAEVRVHV